jgi:hypothetical protein
MLLQTNAAYLLFYQRRSVGVTADADDFEWLRTAPKVSAAPPMSAFNRSFYGRSSSSDEDDRGTEPAGNSNYGGFFKRNAWSSPASAPVFAQPSSVSWTPGNTMSRAKSFDNLSDGPSSVHGEADETSASDGNPITDDENVLPNYPIPLDASHQIQLDDDSQDLACDIQPLPPLAEPTASVKRQRAFADADDDGAVPNIVDDDELCTPSSEAASDPGFHQ